MRFSRYRSRKSRTVVQWRVKTHRVDNSAAEQRFAPTTARVPLLPRFDMRSFDIIGSPWSLASPIAALARKTRYISLQEVTQNKSRHPLEGGGK